MAPGVQSFLGPVHNELAPSPNCAGSFVSGGGNVDSGSSCGFGTASDRSGSVRYCSLWLPMADSPGLTRSTYPTNSPTSGLAG